MIRKSVNSGRFVASMDWYETAQRDSLGLCRTCGNEAEGVEPDAEKYKCDACGRLTVYGAEECLMRGFIVDDTPQAPPKKKTDVLTPKAVADGFTPNTLDVAHEEHGCAPKGYIRVASMTGGALYYKVIKRKGPLAVLKVGQDAYNVTHTPSGFTCFFRCNGRGDCLRALDVLAGLPEWRKGAGCVLGDSTWCDKEVGIAVKRALFNAGLL